MVSLPTNVTENYLGSANITCVITGKPLPNVTWYRNGEILHSTGTVTITNTTVNNSTLQSNLTITKLTYDDRGTYNCSGTNSLTNGALTSDSASLTLNLNCE